MVGRLSLSPPGTVPVRPAAPTVGWPTATAAVTGRPPTVRVRTDGRPPAGWSKERSLVCVVVRAVVDAWVDGVGQVGVEHDVGGPASQGGARGVGGDGCPEHPTTQRERRVDRPDACHRARWSAVAGHGHRCVPVAPQAKQARLDAVSDPPVPVWGGACGRASPAAATHPATRRSSPAAAARPCPGTPAVAPAPRSGTSASVRPPRTVGPVPPQKQRPQGFLR